MNLFKRTPRFEDYAEEFLDWSKANHRSGTFALHKNNIHALLAHFAGKPLHGITPHMIEQFKMDRLKDHRQAHEWSTPVEERPNVSAVSVNRALTTLRLLFNQAIKSGEYPGLQNPVTAVSRFPERGAMRVITKEEEWRYFAAMQSGNLWDVARLMLETGMRPQEVMGLRVKDVDLVHRSVSVANSEYGSLAVVLGKTINAHRTIPLSSEAVAILKTRVQLAFNRRDAFLFPSKSSHVKSVRKAHDRSIARAGITPAFRLYDLRHTFATRAAEAGVPLPVLSAILGHASIQMTMRYVHPQEDAKRAAIQKLEVLNLAS